MQVIQHLGHPGASQDPFIEAVSSPPKDLVFKTDLAQKQSQAQAKTSGIHLSNLNSLHGSSRARKTTLFEAVCKVDNERPT